MNIGLFSDAYYPDINGVVSSIATLKSALEKEGHKVYVISNHKGIHTEFEDDVLRLPGIEFKRFYGYKVSSPLQLPGAMKIIDDMNLDIIHVQTEAGIGIYARHVARKLNIPIVYTYHTMYEDYTHYINPMDISLVSKIEKVIIRRLSKKWVNKSQLVIAPSNKTKQKLIDYGANKPIYIIPTGLNLKAFDQKNLDPVILQDIRSSLGFTDDDKVVTYVGRIAKEKQLDIPIKAIRECEDKDIHLVIVGKGTDLSYYQTIAKECNVEDRVHFLGFVESKMVPYYYSAFDCFVSASESETQGMTYIEALASGLCIFGRRDEVLEDLIDEGITGFYFDDEFELAQKFDTFFKRTKKDRISVRKECIEKVKPYATEVFAKDVLSVYDEAIQEHNE